MMQTMAKHLNQRIMYVKYVPVFNNANFMELTRWFSSVSFAASHLYGFVSEIHIFVMSVMEIKLRIDNMQLHQTFGPNAKDRAVH